MILWDFAAASHRPIGRSWSPIRAKAPRFCPAYSPDTFR